MQCEICTNDVTGDLVVSDDTLVDGTWIIRIDETPDRNWICCDSCNLLLCHNCCRYPLSGYCDACIEKYQLYDYLVSIGLICLKAEE